jgi:hypothetical protein
MRGQLDPWQGTIDPKASSPDLAEDAPEPHSTPTKGRERGEQGGEGTEREEEARVGGSGEVDLGRQPPLAATAAGCNGTSRQGQVWSGPAVAQPGCPRDAPSGATRGRPLLRALCLHIVT